MKKTKYDWAAICAASESNRPEEWPYILTVIRNRVESRKYPSTYLEVVRQPLQFSYFNQHGEKSPEATFKAALTDYPGHQFEDAYACARMVLDSPRWVLPFSAKVLNFWSPVSMKPAGEPPRWDFSGLRVFQVSTLDPWRFMFAEEVGRSHPYAGFPEELLPDDWELEEDTDVRS